VKFTLKRYKTSKTEKYLRTNSLFFFFSGVNRNSDDWIVAEQGLKDINFSYYKVFNKTASKTLKGSIYNNITPVINGITFFIKPSLTSKTLSKEVVLTNFKPLLFLILAVKFNNKIYSVAQLKSMNSLNYCENKLLMYQFGITNLKLYQSLK
jgi:hypothetical protein